MQQTITCDSVNAERQLIAPQRLLSAQVDNNFFLAVVPIEQHESTQFVAMFPFSNREGEPQTWDHVKRQISKAGSQGFTYVDVISDFQLLLFLTTVRLVPLC